MITRVVLIGFSGSGKSTVGRLLEEASGWALLDMDAEIERREGTSIPEMFDSKGEPAFRALECEVLLEGLRRERVVISTGGGAMCTEDIWDIVRDDPGVFVVRFSASADELLRRLEAHRQEAAPETTTRRPMLDADDQLGRITGLLAEREPFYSRAHVTIPVANREPERIANDVAELVALGNGTPSTVRLDLPHTQSEIVVGVGTRDTLPAVMADTWPKARRRWIAADAGMWRAHQPWFDGLRESSALRADVHIVNSGESSKSLAGLADLYDWMLEGGVERGDVAIAAGGGVTGDLMGFAAATVLRGIGLVQMPTTLLSMVDSSVGGKTGINHPAGKNLIGAFYQPARVIVDPTFLSSLPARELRSGFAEIIKHGMIQASTPGGENGFLLDVLERNAQAFLALQEPLTSWIIRQNIELKASVVREDEKESRLRAILNFGHTIGHGIEAAGYALLHGEAVAVGMVAAMTIGVEKGLVSAEHKDRLVGLIDAYGLPVRADVTKSVVREKMLHDKKKSGGAQQWVLPLRDGGVEIRTDVSEAEIEAGLEAVLG